MEGQNQCSQNLVMRDFIENFQGLLSQLNDDNLVLAGTNALKLHGLRMNRQANDLDCVLFCPTEKQKQILNAIQSLRIDNPFAPNYESEDIHHLRSLKFKKGDLFLDILISQENTPSDLLLYRCCNMQFKIQNIALNIKAKSSYTLERTGLEKYKRLKDFEDFQDLKNSNFNFKS